MKKIKALALLLLAAIVLNAFTLAVFAESEGVNWYVKHSGNSRPDIDKAQRIIEKYNGYYIDKKVSDTSDKKILYLTFDAGYENGNVSKILDILRDKNVPAAFFLLDHIILKNTDVVMRMTNEGHLVCNHTKNHKDMSTQTKEQIINNLCDLEKIYEQKCGLVMSKYFRFPEGRYSEESLKTVSEMGYKIIFWSFGYPDWDDTKQPNPQKAIDKILKNTHNGEVILLHPTSETNAKILPTLIDKWREMGYSFGTLDELVS